MSDADLVIVIPAGVKFAAMALLFVLGTLIAVNVMVFGYQESSRTGD